MDGSATLVTSLGREARLRLGFGDGALILKCVM